MKDEMKVTPSEWYLLECLWEKSPLTLMQFVTKLSKKQGWSKSTCATMVRRMTAKNIIAYEEEGKTKKFYPLVKKEEISIQETKSFLERIYHGNIGLMLSSLVEQKSLSEEDIIELENILKKVKKNNS